MALPDVKEVSEWLRSGEVAFTETPSLQFLEPVSDKVPFVLKPATETHADPFILISEVKYKEGGLAQAVPYWEGVIRVSHDAEESTYMYGICRVADAPDLVKSLEVYETEQYLWDVHAKSAEVAANVKATGGLRESLTRWPPLKRRAGFFIK